MSKGPTLLQAIDNCLPQTQCRECGYQGCQPYAQAIAHQQENINRCAPGGMDTLVRLAKILNKDFSCYIDEVIKNTRIPQTAKIREAACIGCTKCIQACPVDAIVGCAKHMHTVISQECTGCGLCIDPCPVDCIDLNIVNGLAYDRDKARARFQSKQTRLKQNKNSKKTNYMKAKLANPYTDKASEFIVKKTYIKEAVARAKAKKAKLGTCTK